MEIAVYTILVLLYHLSYVNEEKLLGAVACSRVAACQGLESDCRCRMHCMREERRDPMKENTCASD